MKIQSDDDSGVWPDELTHKCDDAPIRILIVGREHSAVIGDVDSFQRTCFCQACSNCRKEPVHQRPVDRAVRVTPGQQDRQRRPRSRGIHRLHESRRLAHDHGIGCACRIEDCRTLETIVALEITVQGDRRVPIALKPDADNSHAGSLHADSKIEVALLTGLSSALLSRQDAVLAIPIVSQRLFPEFGGKHERGTLDS